jgi:two-component system cell cycle sensor histidine kinase/response regulator CckA
MSGAETRINRELEERLAEAEATIAALLDGQIDAVVDAKSHSPVLLAKAQEALRQSEERYRRIVEITREGVWMLNASHTTTFMNQRMAEMLGCDLDRALGSSPLEFLDQGEGAKLMAYLQRVDAGQIDLRYTRTDGTSLWTLLECAPIFDSAGRYEGSLAMVVDITERKKAELALRHERDRAKFYLDAAEVIMLAVDLDGCITMINRYGCTCLGWTSEELLGRDWFTTCVPAEYRAPLRERLREFLAANARGAESVSIENPIVTKGGTERLFEWRSSVLRDATGAAIGAITSGTDITDRTQSLIDVRTAEERMRFALESADVGIWDHDYNTGVITWSATMERQYGLQAGGFDGTFPGFSAMIHPDDRDAVLASLATAMQDGSDFAVDHRIVRRDGSVRSVHGVGRIHADAQGHALRGVGISLDTTERVLMESRNRQAQKMDAVGQLASGVAHDFNNLLTVILGFAEFLTEDDNITDRNRRDVGEIIKAARRASGLTRQLLAFSRQQVLETVPVDVNRLITDMTGMLGRLIGEHIEIILDLGSRLPPALSDRGQLEQVLMNLLVNARDAMPGGGTVTIKTTHATQDNSNDVDEMVTAGEYVVFTVTDTGVGMSKETQRRLFEPFYTTKETGKGTGLGLSTAYGIVKQSKGFIFADSARNRGTTFRVYLPCAASDAQPLAVAIVAGGRLETARETVLLVEDEVAVREYSRRCLEREGYRVLVAQDAGDAERMSAERGMVIDLLLTDVVMPGCGGPELLARLRRSRQQLKVLYMSGYTEQSETNQAAFRGEPAVLQKPFTGKDLRRRVREILDLNLHRGES